MFSFASEQLLLVLVAVLSISTTLYNVGVLIYARCAKPFRTATARERPLARGAVKALLFIVSTTTASVVYLTVASLIRLHYTAETIVYDAPLWLSWMAVSEYIVYYGVALLPSTLLFHLVWAFRETDRLSRVSANIENTEYDLLTAKNKEKQEKKERGN